MKRAQMVADCEAQFHWSTEKVDLAMKIKPLMRIQELNRYYRTDAVPTSAVTIYSALSTMSGCA
jgi:hypothetical protein